MGNFLLSEPQETLQILEENVEQRLKQAEEFIQHLHKQEDRDKKKPNELSLTNQKQIEEILSIMVQNEIITSDDALRINCL